MSQESSRSRTIVEEIGAPLTEPLVVGPVLPPLGGVVIGMFCGLDEAGSPCVDYPGNHGGLLPARSTVPLTPEDHHREVALMFEGGDPGRPVILGLMQHPVPVEAAVDGRVERLVLNAEREIELRCGKSSITLTRAGKVIIRGEYILSRSAGVNRIRGGSVQIN